MTGLYAPTLKEDPAEAELASHRLLLRAGMIRKSASGLYSYLPLAWRSLMKIEAVIRDEMEGIGAQEMLVPILTDGELWRQSGRWSAYGPELMRLKDRHEREFALGPTHEESFTDLVRNELRSYKQLPVTLYQIQDKFRDELRPRFGLMRGREFIMKDGYSFDADVEGMQKSYNDEKGAYARICERVGLRALPVVADSGQIGGDTSVEFMALADAGEAEIVYCDGCGFAADTEAATAPINLVEGEEGDLQKLETPGCGTIADLAAFLKVPEAAPRKALALVDGDGKPWVCFVPGDHEMNDVKAEHAFGAYHMMSDEELAQYGLVKGFIGPIDLPEGVGSCADESLRDDRVVGNRRQRCRLPPLRAREAMPRLHDWSLVDVITAKAGDICPKCAGTPQGCPWHRGWRDLPAGNQVLETMGATFASRTASRSPSDGLHGIGVSRMLAPLSSSTTTSTASFPVAVAPTRSRSSLST